MIQWTFYIILVVSPVSFSRKLPLLKVKNRPAHKVAWHYSEKKWALGGKKSILTLPKRAISPFYSAIYQLFKEQLFSLMFVWLSLCVDSFTKSLSKAESKWKSVLYHHVWLWPVIKSLMGKFNFVVSNRYPLTVRCWRYIWS